MEKSNTDNLTLLSTEITISDNSTEFNPNNQIPLHTCEYLKCFCLPLIVTAECLPILCCSCCRTKTHPTWNLPFEMAVTVLRASAVNIGRCWCVLRCLTDPPLGVVPTWLPFLPSNIGVVTNITAPHGGEWVYPKDLQSTKRTCCAPCCCEIPGNPQSVSQKYKVLIVLIVNLYTLYLLIHSFFHSFHTTTMDTTESIQLIQQHSNYLIFSWWCFCFMFSTNSSWFTNEIVQSN